MKRVTRMLNYRDIAKIFEEIEIMLISSLKRNLGRHKNEEHKYGFKWSAWQLEKLRSIDKFRRENSRIMNSYTSVIDNATRQIMYGEFAHAMNGINTAIPENIPDTPAEIVREPHFFGVDKTKVDKLVDDVVTLEKHVETAVLRTMDDVYRQTVNKAQLAMSTGTPLQEAIDISMQDFLNKGINCIVYRDGRRVNVADYVRMALRTTAARSALYGKSAGFRRLGLDTVQVSSYGMCSETCLPWQGKVYIDDVFSLWDGEIQERDGGLWGKSHYCGKWFPLLSNALHGGLFHPNCRHTILKWRDGDSLPEPMDNSEIQRRYKLEQQQRQLENKVRRAKRFVEGQSDPDNLKKAKKLLRDAQKELREFIANTNLSEGETILKRDYGKEKIYTANSQNGLTSVTNNGTIETERAISFKKVDKAIEYAKNKLSVSADSLSVLPIEKVNVILSHISRLYAKMPVLNGFVDEIVLEKMSEIAKASIKWSNGSPLVRLKLSSSIFSTRSIDEIESFIADAVKNKDFSPKEGLYGVLKHEFAHMAEYSYTLKRYNYSQADVSKSLDNFEFASQVKELALKNCGLEDNNAVIKNYISQYAIENPAEFIAEAYSSTADNKLVNETKRILKRKWGI